MSLLLPSRPIVVIPELVMKLGLNEAMLLQQVHYWATETNSGVDHDGRRWIYNTIEEWLEQFPWMSASTIKRGFASLKKQGCLFIEQLSDDPRDMTNFYAINYDHQALLDEVKLTPCKRSKRTNAKGQNEPLHRSKKTPCKSPKRAALHTESTSENTTEINTLSPAAPQPDDSTDQNFLVLHPEAVVFDAKKRKWGSADDLTAAEWIWGKIIRMYEQAAECDGEIARPKEPDMTLWANEVRLMCTADGRTHKQICELFGRANRDTFWCKNILSPSKLREKWDYLTLKLSATVPTDTSAGGHWNSAEAWENTL
ncbi:UNVERIFIED_ORG: hypothetical protein J2W64_002729 [Rahnella aquatilis]|uniref:hypothetical protein n=1 Tax=Rahnella sp. 2050 TaxID=3156425 RepID=UPI001B6D9D75|nr:hypothetical protein [Rahnella aquatilis]